jgi:hypothetical protein
MYCRCEWLVRAADCYAKERCDSSKAFPRSYWTVTKPVINKPVILRPDFGRRTSENLLAVIATYMAFH